jgi:AAA family ATP:ADP antiporter
MKALTRKLLGSVVQIRPGELPIVLLMFFYLLLLIGTFAVVKPVRSSLFLQQFGAQNLPYIYLATALLAGGIAWIHSRLFDRFHIVTVQVFTHLFFISNLVLFWLAFRRESPWLSAAFFLWVNVFTVTVNTLFWMFANHYYNPREAKRLYGFINAGGTVGGIASGFAVSATVERIGTENMLLVCAAVLGICILLIYLIHHLGFDRLGRAPESYVGQPPDPRKPVSDEPRPLRTVFASRYARYIALALGLSLVISTLIDYQFNVVVEQTYPGKDAKTAFFSTFTAWVNALSFLFQFFLTSQLLRRLGIGFTLLLLPVTLVGGSLWMGFYPGLAAGIFLKIADGSVRYSVEQSTRDILYLPIPRRLMSRLKTFVDVFVQRLAKGLGSLLILVLTAWLALGFQILSYLAILLAVGWLVCALLLRREYPLQLANFLAQENLSQEPKFLRGMDQTTFTELLKAVESGDEARTLYALDLLEGRRDRQFLDLLRRLVRQGSPRVQARALHLLGELGDTSLAQEAELLLSRESVETQESAIHYLCQCCPSGPAVKMREFLSSDDPRLRAAALVCIGNSGNPQGLRMAEEVIRKLLAEDRSPAGTTRALLARTLRHIRPPSPLHSFLRPLLQDSSAEVVREALRACRQVLRRDFLPLIVEKLAHPELRSEALATLEAHGEKILGTLRDWLSDDSLSPDVRRQLPAVFAAVGNERAAGDLLICLRQPDPHLRYAVIKALNKIRDRNPQLAWDASPIEEVLAEELQEAFRLLREQCRHTSAEAEAHAGEEQMAFVARLHDEFRQSVERVFRLLGLLLPQQEIYTAYRGLYSPRPELKANALELLEAVLPPRWKKLVLTLVDDEIPVEERLRVAESVLESAGLARVT